MATLLSTTHHHRHRNDYSDTESCTVEIDPPSPSPSLSPSSSSSSSCCYLSECSVEDEAETVVVVDLENDNGNGNDNGNDEKFSLQFLKIERDCRICHLSLDGSDSEGGVGMELGCSCKGDLAVSHKHCADAWFKIRGNRTCEICGSIARNVVGVTEVELVEQWPEVNDPAPTAALPPHPAETRHFWQGHRFLNFLLACMVFAFVISWLFHFNVPS